MKKYLLTTFICISWAIHAQVGINENDPKATLEIKKSTKSSQADGILIPRVSVINLDEKDANYTADQHGTLVFVNDITKSAIPKSKTSEITTTGIYYYDSTSSKWKSIMENNYGNGSFTPNLATVTLTGSDVTWTNYKNFNYLELITSNSSISEFNFPKASDFKNKTVYLRNNTGIDLYLTTNSIPPEFDPALTTSDLILFAAGAVRIYSDGTRWYLMSGRLNAG